ncbi:PH domain-containing protein [Cryobacterium sp. PH31-AA6]|uniref:PH domain-containing protein n=1 Tax=Cryobacterium sp. PH31-AA6 TaxID=3046205 RepID=UPI0024B8F826|nr:PH domain-containing protein [Cryobacterium sp. PH31-AA6]MDJ0324874.1 PH domain-containing protein [Cryobacterium sp. PH31-AA6]
MTKATGHGQDEVPASAERVVAGLRPHARVLFWPTVVLVGVFGATGYLYGSLPELWENAALVVGAVIIVVLFWLLPLATWLNRRYTITTRRIIFRRGFFVRTRQELLHSRGYDVTVRKTWLQSLSRSGDVLINAGLEHPLVLRDVPNADLVQQVLHDLMEASQTLIGSRRLEQSAVGDQTAVRNGR